MAPLAIWLQYSRDVASPGGLYSFVREASGNPVALVHGLAWSLSYVLYLAFTCAYVVYFLLPELLPVSNRLQDAAELALPLLLSAAVTLASRGSVRFLAFLGAVQVIVVVLFGVLVALGRPAAPLHHAGMPSASGAGRGIWAVSLLFVCSSLVLYLGGDTEKGRRGIRRSLVWAFVSVAALSTFVSVVVAPWIDRQTNTSAIPGYTVALRAVGRGFALFVGSMTLVSMSGLVLAELIALMRLWKSMFRWSDRRSALVLGGLSLLLDIVSLADPFRFYDLTIGPSLTALFVAQFIVFAVFAFFHSKQGQFRLVNALVAIVAIAWSIYGIYLALGPASAY